MAGNGTKHHKIHSLTGWGVIIGLPFVIFSAIHALADKSLGFIAWLSSPLGIVGFMAFVTAAVWYCKLEFDEVIMDYTDGGLRSLGLNVNRLVAIIVWVVTAFAIYKICQIAA